MRFSCRFLDTFFIKNQSKRKMLAPICLRGINKIGIMHTTLAFR